MEVALVPFGAPGAVGATQSAGSREELARGCVEEGSTARRSAMKKSPAPARFVQLTVRWRQPARPWAAR